MRLYPTRRAIALTAAGAPLAVGVAMLAPGYWAGAAAWIVFAVGLMIADVLLAASPRRLTLAVDGPRVLGAGRSAPATVTAVFEGRGPRNLELAIGVNERLSASPSRGRMWLQDGRGEARLSLTPLRRGEGRLEGLCAPSRPSPPSASSPTSRA